MQIAILSIKHDRVISKLGWCALLAASASWVGCAAGGDEGDQPRDRATALAELQQAAGAPVALEVDAVGTARVLDMTPRFAVPAHAADPAQAAMSFLADHRGVFELDAADAAGFVATRVDVDGKLGLRHVTLQRMFDGIPVFHGAITVHMDAGNGVFRVLGEPSYRVTAPSNRMAMAPVDAVLAAGHALRIPIAPTLTASDGRSATFSAPGMLDAIKVEPRIVQAAAGDHRYAYQVLLSWLDDHKEQQYQLALVDAEGGALLANYSLVDRFTGRVFNVNAQPTAKQSTDTRTVVSFDGDPATSPRGWVGAARKTIGNNAIAATDLNADNTVGANETQPTANASDSFDFPYSAIQDASGFKAAAVTNAFFLVNDYHDRTYALGFTEAAGNFQTSNFGRPGLQSDAVNVDAQDGVGINNANFATPPDGTAPRMQMFLFNIKNGANGVKQDGDFDPSVIYHEYTHGLSNRLVSGGATGCLGGRQSGGMGEGWGDFLGASFLDNPIVGAYVTGNATTGIRRASMADSVFTYNDIKTGALAEVHDAGEVWAATLWDMRKAVGKAAAEQLLVTGMKLTPCNPTMPQARDAIIQADAMISGGANRCKLWTAFAGREMGSGASSPNHNSTSAIVTSVKLPADCAGGGPLQLFVQSYLNLDFGLPSPWTPIAGDFNGDGKADYARLGATGAWLFFGKGNGTFTRGFQSYVDESPALNFGLPSQWEAITGDFNGDGRTDYARVGATGAWLFLGNTNGSFTRGFQSYVDESPPLDFGLPSTWTTITGDFNGDGRTDYARVGATGAWLFFGNANGSFIRGFQSYVDQSPPLDFGQPSTWETITGDFNGDGRTDYARVGATGAWLFFGNANRTFTRGFQSYVNEAPVLNFGQPSTWTTITADLNGDGRTDYARLGDTGAWLFFGNANGSFTRGFETFSPITFGQPSPWQVVTGKFLNTSKTGFIRLGGPISYVYNQP